MTFTVNQIAEKLQAEDTPADIKLLKLRSPSD